MPLFRFSNDIHESALKGEVSNFVSTIGFNTLKARITKLEDYMNKNPFARYLFNERYELEFALWKCVNGLRSFDHLPSFGVSANSRAYSFIYVFNRVHAAISESAKNKLKGSVINGLEGEANLRSLEHELKTIGHFISLGAEVECHDLEVGGYDFRCVRSDLEYEIECKTISVDKGRKIHQYDLLRMSDHLNTDVITMSKIIDGFGILISVEVPSRLTRVPTDLKQLAKDIENAFNKSTNINREEWQVRTEKFLISQSPFEDNTKFDKMNLQNFVKQLAPNSTGQLLMSFNIGRRAVIIDVHSKKPDTYIEQIYVELKNGAAQFSKEKPAILTAAITDLSSQELQLIGGDKQPNGFQAIATRLLGNDQRNYLHTVMFTSESVVLRKSDGSIGNTGTSLNFLNPNHPLYQDDRLRVIKV